MDEATEQEKMQVAEILRRVAQARGVDQQQARDLLHKYVCGGKCDWYRTKSQAAGFDKDDLTDEDRLAIKSVIEKVLAGCSDDEVWYIVHGVLCPGHPRRRPRRATGT